MKEAKNYYVFIGILIFVVTLNILFYFFSADSIVSMIGAKNTYMIVLIIAAIGGLSTVTGAALFASIATFAAGGSDPFFLSLAGGTGIFISDTVFYFLALYGRKSVPEKWEGGIKKARVWIEKYPTWLVLSGMYIYVGFTPLPNDLLMIALVIGGYSYKKIVWVLLAGSFTIAMVTAYFGYLIWG